MAIKFSEPRIITRGPYIVLGAWTPYGGQDESPGWVGADAAFGVRKAQVVHRADDQILGFMYRPHRDNPAIPESLRACFVGAEVTSLEGQPEGLMVTHFSGGEYVVVDCIGDTQGEAAEGVGQAIGMLMAWIPAHGYGYIEGDACFAAGRESTPKPPWVETVYIRVEPTGQE